MVLNTCIAIIKYGIKYNIILKLKAGEHTKPHVYFPCILTKNCINSSFPPRLVEMTKATEGRVDYLK